MIEQRVTLRYGAQQIPAIVQAVQGDTGRDVIFELADYEIPAGATANYYIDKPDGNAVYNSAEVISNTEILAHLTEQALAVPGRNNGQVRILSDGEVITSFDFVLEVEAFRGILRLQSETEINIFDQAIDDAVNTATEEAVAEIQAQTPVVTGMQNSIAPTYSASSTYAVGDYVMYNAQLYRCVTAVTTAEAWTAAHWIHVPIAHEVTDLKSAFEQYINNVNILNRDDTEYVPNKYFYNGGYTENTNYSVFAFNVEANQSITIGCRFRYMGTVNTNIITAETPAGYIYTPLTSQKLYITVFNADMDSWKVVESSESVNDAVVFGSLALNKKLIMQELGHDKNSLMSQKAITDAINRTDTMPYNEQYRGNAQSYTLGTANSIKKNKVINFGCDFSSFGTLNLYLTFGTGNAVENKFSIDSTYLTRTVDGSEKPAVAHGISIRDHINVTIGILITGIKLTIVSNGQSYSAEYNYSNGSVRPSFDVSNMEVSNVDFSWTCKDFKKDLWLFGDSYFSYGDNRWIYYLSEDGYVDNCLIDAYPGESSAYSLPSLKSYIDIAKPKIIVWCLGMNDGGDSSSAPSTQWKNAVDTVISICESNGIIPILATIPTVPSINHEKKNEYVRSSGYQYIDFAKAVGADSSGVWFTGMLSSDNVHPTASGAMALYRQAITDCPQLMITN